MKLKLLLTSCWLLLCLAVYASHGHTLIFCGDKHNYLYRLLEKEAFPLRHFSTAAEGVQAAAKGDALIIVADGCPAVRTTISPALLQTARQKQLRVYIEYPLAIPGDTLHTRLERGVVTSPVFGARLQPISIPGINDCYLVPVKTDSPLVVLAKVAGLDIAAYGLSDVPAFPLLFHHNNLLLATTKMINFATGRYGPDNAWKTVWSCITGKEITTFRAWPSDVTPMHTRSETLPPNAQAESIRKGVDWFSKAHFFIHPDWKDQWKQYQRNGLNPVGPPLPANAANGNGLLCLLEGHASRISYNGQQQYRYWLRADVQGEAAYALAAALLNITAGNTGPPMLTWAGAPGIRSPAGRKAG